MLPQIRAKLEEIGHSFDAYSTWEIIQLPLAGEKSFMHGLTLRIYGNDTVTRTSGRTYWYGLMTVRIAYTPKGPYVLIQAGNVNYQLKDFNIYTIASFMNDCADERREIVSFRQP